MNLSKTFRYVKPICLHVGVLMLGASVALSTWAEQGSLPKTRVRTDVRAKTAALTTSGGYGSSGINGTAIYTRPSSISGTGIRPKISVLNGTTIRSKR